MLDAFRIKCGVISFRSYTGNPSECFRWNPVADMKTRTLLLSNHGLVKLQLFVKAFSFYNCFLLHPFFFFFFYYYNEMLASFLYHVINLRVHIVTLFRQCKIHYLLKTFRPNNQQVFVLILTLLYVFQLSSPLRSV